MLQIGAMVLLMIVIATFRTSGVYTVKMYGVVDDFNNSGDKDNFTVDNIGGF